MTWGWRRGQPSAVPGLVWDDGWSSADLRAGADPDELFGSYESEYLGDAGTVYRVHGLLEDEVASVDEARAIIEAEARAEIAGRIRDAQRTGPIFDELHRRSKAERPTSCIVTECGCYFGADVTLFSRDMFSDDDPQAYGSKYLFFPEFFNARVYERVSDANRMIRKMSAPAKYNPRSFLGGRYREIVCPHITATRAKGDYTLPKIGVLT